MIFVPNSWGTLREFNPHHEPAGAKQGSLSIGGRFARKPGGPDTDTPVARMDPSVAPPAGEPHVFRERPTGKKWNFHPDSSVVTTLANRGNAQVLQALGIEDGPALARELVSGVRSENFEVLITTIGADAIRPDPQDPAVRGDYQRYLALRADQVYESDRQEYLRGIRREGFRDLAAAYEEIVAQFPDGTTLPEGAALMGSAYEQFYDLTLPLIGAALDPVDGAFREQEGREAIQGMIQQARAQGFVLPREFHGGFDVDEYTRLSRYFGRTSGRDLDAGHRARWEAEVYDPSFSANSFEDWYENHFEIPPSEWKQEDLDLSQVAATFRYTGDKGTEIVREFLYDRGNLTVYHHTFLVGEHNTKGEGLAKELFRGSLPAYERIGVHSITVRANVDIGGYSWARYGFEAKFPGATYSEMTRELTSMVTRKILTETEVKALTKVLKADDPRNVWEMADARLFVGQERAKKLASIFEKVDDPVWNRLMREDADRGVVNIGRLVLTSMQTWDGVLRLQDPDHRRRLNGYVGY